MCSKITAKKCKNRIYVTHEILIIFWSLFVCNRLGGDIKYERSTIAVVMHENIKSEMAINGLGLGLPNLTTHVRKHCSVHFIA